MTRTFRAILACALLNSGFALGGQVRLSPSWDAPPPLAVESPLTTAAWLFDEDAFVRRPAFDPELDATPSVWHTFDDTLTTSAVREHIQSAPRSELRDTSQQPVAVPLPPAVIGGAAVALLAASRHVFKRRRPIARTFR